MMAFCGLQEIQERLLLIDSCGLSDEASSEFPVNHEMPSSKWLVL